MAGLFAWLNSSSAFFLRYGLWGLFAVSFAESSFFPIPPDLILIPLCILNPRLATWYAFICTASSVAGGVFGHFIGSRAGRPLLARLFSQKMIDRTDVLFQRYGGWAVGIAAFTPIPYKLFTIASGVFGMARTPVIIASIIGRGARFFAEAVIIAALGQPGIDFISKNFEMITVAVTVVALVAWLLFRHTRLWQTLKGWSDAQVVRAQDVYSRRLRPLGTFGYYLLAGVGLTGLSLILFTKVATDLLERELDAFDASGFRVVQSVTSGALTALMKLVSFFGSELFLIAVALAAAIWLFCIRRRNLDGITLLATLAGAWTLNAFLQGIFRRPHPPVLELAAAANYSFPSQHSLLAFALYFVLAYLAWERRHSRWRLAGVIIAPLMALAIGVSRVYLGFDYPSDVVAGLAAGLFWAVVCMVGMQTALYLQQSRR